jgi:hypothetical protein
MKKGGVRTRWIRVVSDMLWPFHLQGNINHNLLEARWAAELNWAL